MVLAAKNPAGTVFCQVLRLPRDQGPFPWSGPSSCARFMLIWYHPALSRDQRRPAPGAPFILSEAEPYSIPLLGRNSSALR